MIHVCEELERRCAQIPVVIGGATTSELHTAVKIAPVYSGPVVHAANAGDNCRILAGLLGPNSESYVRTLRERQEELRREYERQTQQRSLVPIVEARKERRAKPASEIAVPLHTGRVVFSEFEIAAVEPLIDWNFFFPAWGIKGRYPEVLDHPERGGEARKLFDDARSLLERIREEKLLTLQGVAGIFPAVSHKDDLIVTDPKGKEHLLPMLRNQTAGEEHLCLSDFIADRKEGVTDYVGCFALTAGVGLDELVERFKADGDDYNAIMAKLLADRLTEAFAETVHRFVRHEMWGYAPDEKLTPQEIIRGGYRGLRMAFGYPATPDHALKRDLFDLLHVEQFTRMRLTDNNMISPGEALCGLMLSDGNYFSVGRIDTKQLLDYAARRRTTPDEIRRLLPNNA